MACKIVLSSFSLLYVAINVLWIVVIQGDDVCRTLVFQPPIDGSYLDGHVNKSYVIESKDICELKCYMDNDCKSTNVGILGRGKYLCELSDSDHELHPEDLKIRHGFTYTATENFCINNRCSSNSRCQTGFTDRGYRCVCSTGFTGEYCDIEILGQHSTRPGDSCKNILESGHSSGDAEYWIDPGNTGTPFKAYCDMTTDEGGWLLVTNVVADSSASFGGWSAVSSYRGISEHGNNRLRITKTAMKNLRTHLNFTQLRFHCSKQEGRTFHVTTVLNSTGEAVVQYFSGQTNVLPASCGSFQRMADDNSQLSVTCDRWGNDGSAHHVGKWGHQKKDKEYIMYNHAAFVAFKNHWVILDSNQLCDDKDTADTLSPGDFWKVYVR